MQAEDSTPPATDEDSFHREPFAAYVDWNRVVPAYEAACFGGSGDACLALAEFSQTYREGEFSQPLFDRLSVMCDEGNAVACRYHGLHPDQYIMASLRRGCELGDAMSCGGVAAFAEPAESEALYRQACDLGDPSACKAISETEPDPKAKSALEQKACDLETAFCFNPDPDRLLRECAETGWACQRIGFGLSLGLQDVDVQRALDVLEDACRRQPSMCEILGEVYASHRVPFQDLELAAKHHRRSCQSEEAYRMRHLDNGCVRWVELTCRDKGVCTEETLEAIMKMDPLHRVPFEAMYYCKTGDGRAQDALARCDCGLVCENGELYSQE